MSKVRSYVVNLVFLGLLCLVIEQVGYCFLSRGYFFKLLVSPVFWMSVSSLCFYVLWKIRPQKHPDTTRDEPDKKEYIFDPVFDDPMNMANPDNMFSRNLRCW